jgi:hypothetical protein
LGGRVVDKLDLLVQIAVLEKRIKELEFQNNYLAHYKTVAIEYLKKDSRFKELYHSTKLNIAEENKDDAKRRISGK